MRNTLKALALLTIIVLFSGNVIAADTTQPSKRPTVRGRVEKVDGTKITIRSKGEEVVIDTDDNTKFFLNGKPATLDDVKENEHLTATPQTGVAEEVRLSDGKYRRKAAETTMPSDTTMPSNPR